MSAVQGPELRIGRLASPLTLSEGQQVFLGTGGIPCPACHSLAAFRRVLDRTAQVLADELDGFQMEHIGDGAVALGDVALKDVYKRQPGR